DERRRCHADRGEDRGAENDGDEERSERVRERRVMKHAAEQEERDYLQHEDDERRRQHRSDVRRRRQRRRAQALEDSRLAADDELDREPCERRVRAAVAEQAGEQRLRRGNAVDLPGVDGAEQQEEEKREDEDEDRRLAAAPG